MSPTTIGTAASQLRQLIYYHLDNDMLDNANFLAARLHALEPRKGDSAHLLALTYARLRQYRAAYDYSHRHGVKGDHVGCAYVFAQACLELGRNAEGVQALEKARGAWAGKSDWQKHSETSRRHIPDAPAVLTLLAKLHQAHGEFRKAGDCYIEAHRQNPFVWDAFEGLCEIGADLKVENMFKATADMPGALEHSTAETQIYVDEDSRQPLAPQSNYSQSHISHDDPFTSDQEHLSRVRGKPIQPNGYKQSSSEWDTPVASGATFEDDVSMDYQDDTTKEPPAAPSRRQRPGQHFEASDRPRPPQLRSQSELSDDPPQAQRKPSAGGQKRTLSGAASQVHPDSTQPRRSNRLYTQTTATRTTRLAADSTTSVAGRLDRTGRTAKPATGTKGRNGAMMGRVVSGNRKVLPPDGVDKQKEKRAASRNSERSAFAAGVPAVTSAIAAAQKHVQSSLKPDVMTEREAMAGLLDNFRQLAVGSQALARFRLPEAIHVFRSLPSAQRETPWVLAQLAKAYYEASDYKSSEEVFARLMKMQPSRVEDMEIYSTVLWHLRRDSVLSYLCRLLRDNHFDAPQTWVAIGNAFSLSREHEQAISAFTRATQLDENFAYAWTLMGHENMQNEAFDSALASFRKAVAIDKRGYGGWYGLAKVYEQMGKYEDAERHFRIAHGINPSNCTLLVHIGVVLEKMRNKPAALAMYARALERDPTSQLARFKKARVLMLLRDFTSALEELHILQEHASSEPNVFFLLGRCYKGLGDRGEALRCFTTALNLDVKAAPIIKEAIELLNEEDDDSDED